MIKKPWERRLKDLAMILDNCSKTYFEPELFRMNLNQFLQTSRTVTFIIQKNKDSIPNFESWYEENVLEPLKSDKLMVWAKDSRNIVEKQGDLEMFSSANAKLIFSYIDDNDVEFVSCEEMLGVSVKKLVRLAQQKIPTYISDAAAIQIERRWVANSLPDWELLHALTTIYAKVYESCKRLALYLNQPIEDEIPAPVLLEMNRNKDRKVGFIKIRDLKKVSFEYQEYRRDSKNSISEDMKNYIVSLWGDNCLRSLEEVVRLYSSVAQKIFSVSGYHMSIVFFLDKESKVVDMVGFTPADQVEKYIFWRMVAERARVIEAKGVVFISETWIRDTKYINSKPIYKLPVIGEELWVVGADINGNRFGVTWKIKRDSPGAKGELCEQQEDNILEGVNFLTPVLKAIGCVM